MRYLLGIVAVVLPCSLLAQPRAHVGGELDVYLIPSANLDVSVPGLGSGDDDGDGFGARIRAPISDVLRVSGEYQSTSYDDTNIDLDQLRAGLEIALGHSGVVIEYVAAELDGDDIDGFGIHWRFNTPLSETLDLFGQIGYLALEDDDSGEDVSGGEFSIGVALRFAPQVSGFVDYRLTALEDDADTEVDFSDFRIGVRFGF